MDGEEIFSDVEDDDEYKAGAPVNDDEGLQFFGARDASELFDLDDFRSDRGAMEPADHLSDNVLPLEALDNVRNAVEDRHPPSEESHPLRICDEALFNTPAYFEAVYGLLLGEIDDLSLDEDGLERFERRKRTEWAGADSMHDALLLIQNESRNAFDLAIFETFYPHWQRERQKM